MFVYLKIDNATDLNILEVIKRSDALAEYNTKDTAAENGKPFLVEATIVVDPIDEATQVRMPWVASYDGTTATYTHPVRAKTQEELDADQQAADDVVDDAAIKVDPQVRALLNARPAQIENWIDNNVTDLASAKTAIKVLAKAVSMVVKYRLRD